MSESARGEAQTFNRHGYGHSNLDPFRLGLGKADEVKLSPEAMAKIDRFDEPQQSKIAYALIFRSACLIIRG